MSNLYEGAADSRQSDAETEVTSRFRPRYRALNEAEVALHDEIKTKAAELEALFNRVGVAAQADSEGKAVLKHGRYHSLAMTSLEQSVMWIVKELTA